MEATVTLTKAEMTTLVEALACRMDELWDLDNRILEQGGQNHPARRGVQGKISDCLYLSNCFAELQSA